MRPCYVCGTLTPRASYLRAGLCDVCRRRQLSVRSILDGNPNEPPVTVGRVVRDALGLLFLLSATLAAVYLAAF